MNIYFINGWGNYSHSYNWDDGLTIGQAEIWPQDKIRAWDKYITDNPSQGNYIPSEEDDEGVYILQLHEHGGSRNVLVCVIAETPQEAEEMAQEWAEAYYPSINC